MKKMKYLYIDDENGDSETSTINGFNDQENIDVEKFQLSAFRSFESLKKEIVELRKNNRFDGLIIDLRLDGNGEDSVEFTASAISQELRTITAENIISAFPIVLCSTEEKIKQTYTSDKTSHDLFDYKLSKSNPNPDWIKLSCKLYSLAKGYNWLSLERRSIYDIIGLESTEVLDSRILDSIEKLSVNYDFAHYVIKNFFHQTNPLINERILAARLGIDIELTPKNSWNKVKHELFKEARYTGLFGDGWERWWADKINDIFKSFKGEKLPFLNAEKRVQTIKEIIGIQDLVYSKPIDLCNSSEFWVICEGTKSPIDPLEAFKIYTTNNLKPWQESKYLSLYAILERIGIDRELKPHPSELDRIEQTKDLLGLK